MSEHGPSEWLALHRVHDGGVTKSAGAYLDHGHPVPHHMTGVFDRLIWSGLVTVAGGDPVWSVRRLSLSDAGQARYATLCEQWQRTRLEVPAPEFRTLTTSGGTRSTSAGSARVVAPPGAGSIETPHAVVLV